MDINESYFLGDHVSEAKESTSSVKILISPSRDRMSRDRKILDITR